MLTIPPLEKIISRSRSSKMRTTSVMTNSPSSVTRVETRADKNGSDLVYHRSDCGYPRYRVYGNGGDWDGSKCGEWIPIIGDYFMCGVYYTVADIVWYGDNDSVRNTYNNIKNRNESGWRTHNWTTDEIRSFVNAMNEYCSSYN